MSAYRGRFAPSPTGPLHFGSLVAAVGSYLSARCAGGAWLLRIEDLDPPRVVPGAADQIVRTLDAFGFQWNESIWRQSSRTDAYEAAITRLLASGDAFLCSCTRAELEAVQTVRADELHYPGWCRSGPRVTGRDLAVRMRVPAQSSEFIDQLQGPQSVDVGAEVGDFVIRRRDRLHAYQLAVVIDDAAQDITHVVRGVDLLNSTARQMILQQALRLPTPEYAHLPLATDPNGIKLSKSTGAAAVDPDRPAYELWRALRFLRQEPPDELRRAPPATLWEWAIQHWHVQPLHGMRQAAVDDSG